MQVLLDFRDVYFVDDVAGRLRGHVGVLEDASAGISERQPFDGRGPCGCEDDHGDTHGAEQMHRAGVERERYVGEAHEGGEFEQAGATGDACSGEGEAGAKSFDSGRLGGGANEDDLHVVLTVQGFGDCAEAFGAPGF